MKSARAIVALFLLAACTEQRAAEAPPTARQGSPVAGVTSGSWGMGGSGARTPPVDGRRHRATTASPTR